MFALKGLEEVLKCPVVNLEGDKTVCDQLSGEYVNKLIPVAWKMSSIQVPLK